MKQLITQYFRKGSFARNVSILAGGTAAGQVITVLASLILTRLYRPADFGLLAVFSAFLAFFTVIAAGRYELCIVLPEQDQDAADIAVLSTLCVIFTAVISTVLAVFFSSNISSVLKSPELSKYLWLVPVGVICAGVYNIFSKWAIRNSQFTTLARTRIFQSAGVVTIKIAGYKIGALALIGGTALGQGIGATSLVLSALRRPEFKSWSWRGLWKQAVRYRRFPLYSTWTALFNVASLQLVPIVFMALYGSTVTGLYALTLRVLSLPASLIGAAVGNVFLSEGPTALRENRLAPLVESLHGKLAMFGIPPLMLLLFWGPDIFAIVFGEEWRSAGRYARWMAPWIYLELQWSPLSTLATVLELQRAGLVSQILTFISRFGVLMGCYAFGVIADKAVLSFAIVSAVVYFARMSWFISKAGVCMKQIIRTDLKYITVGLLAAVPIWLVLKVIK